MPIVPLAAGSRHQAVVAAELRHLDRWLVHAESALLAGDLARAASAVLMAHAAADDLAADLAEVDR